MRKPKLKATSRGVLYADPKDILRCDNAKIQISSLLRLMKRDLLQTHKGNRMKTKQQLLEELAQRLTDNITPAFEQWAEEQS